MTTKITPKLSDPLPKTKLFLLCFDYGEQTGEQDITELSPAEFSDTVKAQRYIEGRTFAFRIEEVS